MSRGNKILFFLAVTVTSLVLLCSCHRITAVQLSDNSAPSATKAAVTTTSTTIAPTTTKPDSTTTMTISPTTTVTRRQITEKTTPKSSATASAITSQEAVPSQTSPTTKWINAIKYKVEIQPISFHYESTDYTVFYEAIKQYGGKTITDEFHVEWREFCKDINSDTGEWEITAYYLDFATKINDCPTTERFTFLLDLENGKYVCKTMTCTKPKYNPDTVKAPRKPTAKEEKVALKSEKRRVLEKLKKELPGLTFVITDQEVEYHYDIEKDRNYFVVITSYTDLEDEGWNSRERAEFEIER